MLLSTAVRISDGSQRWKVTFTLQALEIYQRAETRRMADGPESLWMGTGNELAAQVVGTYHLWDVLLCSTA